MVGKSKIVTFDDEVSNQLLELIAESDVELISDSKYDGNSDDVSCVIVKDHIGPYKQIAQKFDSFLSSVPLVSTGDVANRCDFIASGGRMIVNEAIIGNTVCDSLLRRVNTGDSSLHLEDIFGDKLDYHKNVKISSILGVGHYSDIIAYDAHSAGFNSVSIRGFVTNITSYFAYLFRENMGSYPLDVEYGKNDDSFIVQFCVPVSRFISEYIYEAFSPDIDRHNPFKSLLGQALDFSDLTDICYSTSTGKLIIAGVWRSPKTDEKEKFPSLIISEIESFHKQEAHWDELRNNPQLALEKVRLDLEKEAAQTSLSGIGARNIVNASDFLKKNPLILKNIINYIKRLRDSEDAPIPAEKLVDSDVSLYLKDYPNSELVKRMSSSDRIVVLNALLDPAELDDIMGRVKDVTDRLNDGSEKVNGGEIDNDFFQQLMNNLEGMERFEFNEMVHGTLGEAEGSTLVKGTKEDLGEDSTLVAGTREDLTEEGTLIAGTKEDLGEQLQRINGERETINDDVWQVKGNSMKAEMRTAAMRVKSRGGSVNDIKKEIQKVIEEHLNIKENQAGNVSANFINIIASNIAVDETNSANMITDGPQIVAESETFRIAKLIEELHHKNVTIGNLQKMVMALKVENGSNKCVKDIISSTDDGAEQLSQLATRVKGLERNIVSRDQVIENLKIKFQRLGYKQAASEEEAATASVVHAEGDIAKADYMKLKSNHDSIRTMLQVANNKISNLTEQLTTLRGQSRERNDVGMERLKDSLKNSQLTITEVQKEKKDLQILLKKSKIELDAINQKKDSDTQVDNTGDKKNELQLREMTKAAARLKEDLDKSNEKHRADMQKLSDQTRMVKALEIQVIKLSHQTKKGDAGVTNEQASSEEKLQYKIKQLETINDRLDVASRKSQEDLNERKKEVMQHKSENTMLKNKLQALERKVMRK